MSDNFRAELTALGLKEGDTVLMHSSMKALGTKKTPEEFIGDIEAVIGESGTLLVPTLTYAYTTRETPFFSVRETPPCIGLIPTRFLAMDGVIRSVHPTHSVAAKGRLAREMTREHESDDTPVGIHSPFMKLTEVGGKLLFVGDVLRCCTFMHGVEELVHTPYTLQKEPVTYVIEDYDGKRYEHIMLRHDFHDYDQRYDRVAAILTPPEISFGRVGAADCTLIDARALKREAMKKFAENIYYFVDKIEE